MHTVCPGLCQTLVPTPADEVVKEVYGGDKDEPREGVVAIQGGGLPLDAGDCARVLLTPIAMFTTDLQ